jgi:peptide/nickel transport system substrate-binding protein
MGGPRQRALLALLLLSANRAISRDRLIEELMLDPPGEKAARALTVQVSRLRKALGSIDGSDPRLVASPPGYMLRVKPGELDLDTFEQLLADGRSALEGGDPAGAAAAFREAEAVWRGRPLADLEFEPFARLEVERLEELRLAAVEERIEAELEVGRHAALVPELEALVTEHPLRERLRGLLMIALYRAGRQAEALNAYRDGRRELLDELGLEPAPELQDLERAILTHDPALRPERPILTHDPAPRRERAIPAHDPAVKPAPRPGPTAKRPGRLGLAVGLAAGLGLAAAIVVVLISGGSSSARVSGDEIGAIATGTGQLALALPVSSPPTSVAVGRDRAIWVASAAAGTVSRIDSNTRAVTNIPVGSDPVAVAVAPDGSVWVANSGDGTVQRVSPSTEKVVATVPVGAGPSALVATDNAVWVANMLNASVSKIDPSTDTVVTFPVGSEPAGIAVGDGSIWVADQGDGTVYRLDQRTGAQVAVPIPVGNGPINIAFGDGAAWVINSTDGTLSRIDAQSNAVSTIPVGQGPYAVAVGAGQVWVSDEYGNAIARVDPARMTVSQTTKTNSAPLGLALAGDRLWIATDGTGAAAHRGGVLNALASGTWYATQDVGAFDPGSAYTSFLMRVLVMTSDGLVGYRRAGGIAGSELVPDLAVALPAPTDNGRTYRFQLRAGIRYSNGVPLRASDFPWGLERAFRVGGGPIQYFATLVGGQQCMQRPARCDLSRGIVADDAANTVTFHLTKPDPELLNQLTLPAAFPVPPGTPVHLRARWVPGTGAYKISYYRPAASNNPHAHGLLVLTRNPYFHQWSAAAQPAGFPNRIVVRTNYTLAQQVAAVKHGRADLVWDAPPQTDIAALSQSYASQLHPYPNPETTYLWLNARSAPFDSPLARQAFNYAVDRGALSQIPVGPYAGTVTCQLLPPDSPGFIPYCPYTVDPTRSGKWSAPDVAKAQALVRQSRTSGARVTLIEPANVGAGYGQALVATLRKIGYRARLLEFPPTQYPPLADAPAKFYARFQAGLGWWLSDYVAASSFFEPLVDCANIASGSNSGGFCDHSLDANINTALSDEAVRPGVALQEWTAIDRKVTNAGVLVPLSNELGSDFVAERVGNYQHNPQWGVLIDQLWVR